MMQEAQQHLEAGEFAEAEAIYRTILAEQPGNTEAVFMLAMSRQQQGDMDEAIRLMRRAAKQDPENAQVQFSLGTLLMQVRSKDEARECYLKALQIDPFHVGAHNGLAYAELSAGNFTAAEKAANLALTEEPDNVQALVYMGTAKLEQEEFTKAISYLQEALKHAPEHQAAQVQLGRAFLAAGNAGFAMQCFQNAAEAQPESGVVWDYLGTAQYANGMLMDAAESFQRALSLGRTEPAVFRGLAECQRALGYPEQAEQTLKMASNGGVGKAEIALLRSELMIARGVPKNALEILQHFEGLGVDLMRARAYEQLRDIDQALAVIEPHVESGEAGPAARMDYVRLLAKAGREGEADAIVDELLALDEPPVMARIYRGSRLARSGAQEGVSMLEDVLAEEDIDDVERRRVRKILASALDAEGRFEEAAGHLGELGGRLSQAHTVAGGVAAANRELREAGSLPGDGRRETDASLPSDPVFLFAWPGSGWEWLAAGLGAHSRVKLIADKPATQAQRRALISEPAGRDALAGFSADHAVRAARRYWQDLESGGLEPGDRTTVDTLWISADMLPTLATIFPRSRVLVVNREPEAMVLEWFRAGYADLEDMAAVYTDQRAGLDAYRKWLDLEFIDVDGEALISRPGEALKGIVEVLGLDWEPAVGERVKELARDMVPPRGTWKDYREALQAPLAALHGDGADGSGS